MAPAMYLRTVTITPVVNADAGTTHVVASMSVKVDLGRVSDDWRMTARWVCTLWIVTRSLSHVRIAVVQRRSPSGVLLIRSFHTREWVHRDVWLGLVSTTQTMS
jgi:hypothetical protein